MKSPSATFSAASSSRRRRRAWAPATSQPARQRREQRDRARDQDLAADQGDVVVDVGEAGGEDRDPARLAVVEQRHRRLPKRSPPTASTALAIGPAAAAPRGRVVGAIAVRSSSESATTKAGSGPSAPSRTPSTVTRGPARWSIARSDRAKPLLRDPAVHRRLESRACSPGDLLEPRSCSAVRLESQLRDDVEVDEPDRRRRDDEEQQRRAGCEPSSRATRRESGSRLRGP